MAETQTISGNEASGGFDGTPTSKPCEFYQTVACFTIALALVFAGPVIALVKWALT